MLFPLPAILVGNRAGESTCVRKWVPKMKSLSPGVSVPKPNLAAPRFPMEGAALILAPDPSAASIVEELMPYGEAVKAIFVKANGLTAYQKAFGVPGSRHETKY